MTRHRNARRGWWLIAVAVLMLGAASWDASRADQKTASAPWIGEWEVTVEGQDKFTLKLEQGRRGLYGTITPGDGQAVGRAYEGVLHLRCYENGKRKSSAQLKLSEDGKSFTGASKNEGEDKEHPWSGTRK